MKTDLHALRDAAAPLMGDPGDDTTGNPALDHLLNVAMAHECSAELAKLRASVPVLQAQVEEATRQRDEARKEADAHWFNFCERSPDARRAFNAEKDRDAARAEAEQWRREHEVMCIEAKDARARSRQDADERDAACADVERLTARVGVLREALREVLDTTRETAAAHATAAQLRGRSRAVAALASPDEAAASRDARIARFVRAVRDAEWLLVLGVAGVEPTPCMPEQMRGAFAAVRAAALEEAAERVLGGSFFSADSLEARFAREVAAMLRRAKTEDVPEYIKARALSAQPAEPTPKGRP